jgi:hypothetical protein
MNKIVLKYGLISGLILVAMVATIMTIAGDSIDFERGEIYGYIFIIAAFSMIFLAIREYRDKLSGGIINFNKGFRIGILITLIASVFYMIAWMVYFNFIDDSFIEKYTAYYIEKVKTSGKPQVEIEKEISAFNRDMANYNNPFVMALFAFLEVFPVGLIISVLCAFLMRRNPVKNTPPQSESPV